MASIVNALIATACINMSGQTKEACRNSLDAGAKQTGIEQTLNTAQKNAEKVTKKEASKIMGKASVDIVGGGLFLAKALSDKSIGANIPNMGLADKIRLEVGQEKSQIKMEWKFD